MLKRMPVPPTVVFTKFENHLNDIKTKIIEQLREKDEEIDAKEMEKRIEKRAIEVVSKFFHDITHNQGLSRARYFLFNPGRATSCYEFNYSEEAKEVFNLEKIDPRRKDAQARMLRINEIDSVHSRVNALVS